MPLTVAKVLIASIAPPGPLVTLDRQAEVAEDASGNVSITWRSPTTAIVNSVLELVSHGVAQYRNRLGYYLLVADPGARLVQVQWQEWDPWASTVRTRSAKGALALAQHRTSASDETLAVVLYVGSAIYERGTGEILESSGVPE